MKPQIVVALWGKAVFFFQVFATLLKAIFILGAYPAIYPH